MLTALEVLQSGFFFALDIIDVDQHPDLAARYSALVPVLLDGETEICHYFLDVDVLAAYLHRKV